MEIFCDSGNSNRGSINLAGWDGAEDGRVGPEEGDMEGSMADSC